MCRTGGNEAARIEQLRARRVDLICACGADILPRRFLVFLTPHRGAPVSALLSFASFSVQLMQNLLPSNTDLALMTMTIVEASKH